MKICLLEINVLRNSPMTDLLVLAVFSQHDWNVLCPIIMCTTSFSFAFFLKRALNLEKRSYINVKLLYEHYAYKSWNSHLSCKKHLLCLGGWKKEVKSLLILLDWMNKFACEFKKRGLFFSFKLWSLKHKKISFSQFLIKGI